MAEAPGNPRTEDAVSVSKLEAAADAAATQVGHLYATFLLFGLYLAITVGATTHEQLLYASPVVLPLLNVEIPLFGFYWVAPALFVLMHFNLLLQFLVLAQKLWPLDLAIERGARDVRRRLLHPLAFSQMLIGRHHRLFIRVLYRVMIWMTVIVLPILVLLSVQARFLPYHDAWTTMWHRVLVTLDVLLLLIVWPCIVRGRNATAAQTFGVKLRDASAHRVALRTIGRFAHGLRNIVAWSLVAIASLGSVFASLFILTFPGDPDPRIGDPMEETLIEWFAPEQPPLNSEFVVSLTKKSFANPQTIAGGIVYADHNPVVPAETGLIARNLVVPEAREIGGVPTKEQIGQFGEEVAWQAFGGPLSFRGRDLRYSNLSRSTLAHADFRFAYLKHANLEDANLQGSNFEDADLQGARFFDSFGANLQGAHLPGANLQRASLIGANLQGADLTHASA